MGFLHLEYCSWLTRPQISGTLTTTTTTTNKRIEHSVECRGGLEVSMISIYQQSENMFDKTREGFGFKNPISTINHPSLCGDCVII